MKAYFALILLLIGTSVGFAEDMSFSDEGDRSPAVTPWKVENKDGAMVCVPPPAVPHKKHYRKAVKKTVAQVCETKTVVKTEVVEKQVTVEKEVRYEPKNRVRLMGGQGLSSTSLDLHPDNVLLAKHYGPVFGIGYERSLDFKWLPKGVSVGAEVLTNPTWLISVGYSW